MKGTMGFLEAPTPGSVLGEGDAPAMARPREYSEELRERTVRFYSSRTARSRTSLVT